MDVCLICLLMLSLTRNKADPAFHWLTSEPLHSLNAKWKAKVNEYVICKGRRNNLREEERA